MLLKKVYTLVFVQNDGKILLGFKKRGLGVNKWNGFGGKVERNETVIDAAVRELREECCITIKGSDLKNVGHLDFTFEGESTVMDVRVYTVDTFQGAPEETEEMRPNWFDRNQIPYSNMWPDDKIWFPYMITNRLFYGRFHYQDLDTILSYSIKELNSMEEFYAQKK